MLAVERYGPAVMDADRVAGRGRLTARCRCSVDLAAGTGYASFLGALLDQFTN